MSEEKQLESVIGAMVEEAMSDDPGLFMVGLKLKGTAGNQRLIILIDGDEGVTIEQCGKISRTIGGQLEEQDLLEGKYHLEVSSAGVDFPLQIERQYVKNIGRSVQVTLKDGNSLKGKLKEVKNNGLILEEQLKKEQVLHEIKLDEIDKTIVLVSFK